MQSELINLEIGKNTKISKSSGNKEQKFSKSRKIRCIQEFDNLNRSSLAAGLHQNVNCVENVKTKKCQKLDFLPKVELDRESSKENSPENNSNNMSHKTSRQEKIISLPSFSPSSSDQDDEIDFKSNSLKKDLKVNNTNIQVNSKKMSTPNNTPSKLQASSTNQDDEIDFKSKSLKKDLKVNNTNIGVNCKKISTPNNTPRKLQACSSLRKDYFQKHERSLCKNENKNSPSVANSNNISLNNNHYRQNLTNPRKSSQTESRSYEILKNNVPDTSGNNQGLFEVTYPIEEEFINNTSLVNLSSLELTFEKVNSKQNNDLSMNLHKISPSLNKSVVSRSQNIEQNRKSEVETFRKKLISEPIINLITPSPNKTHSIICNKSLHTPTPRSSVKSQNYTNEKKSLIRTNTFTKEDDNTDVSNLCSPDKPVTKSARKRWTKMLGVSLLDNSGNVQLISAPSENDSLIEPSGNILSLNGQTKKHESQSSHKYLAASSTPVIKSKTKSPKISHKAGVESKSIKKTKMPNFAQIHQKAYDKLENIKEMSERKAARAQKLLSGHKPNSAMIKTSPSKTRKALTYVQKQIENGIPEIKHVVKPFQTVECAKNISKPVQRKIESSKEGTSNIPVLKQVKIISGNKTSGKKKSLDKRVIPKPGVGTTKSQLKRPLQQEHLIAMGNKKPIATDTAEKRRKAVQNVRTNRRFELLMQMRKNRF